MTKRYTEQRTERVRVLEDSGAGVLRFEAVVSEADWINKNRRVYPAEVLFPAFTAFNTALIGGISSDQVGTVDHPEYQTGISDLGVLWESFRFEGNQVIGTATIIPTAKGNDLAAVIQAGVRIGFSTRGYGASKEETRDGKTVCVLTDYTLESVDAVTTPSVGQARIRKFAMEGVDVLDELLEKAIADRALAEAKAVEVAASLATANAALAALEASAAALTATVAAAEARTAALEAELSDHRVRFAADALEAKLLTLTGEHRFGATIRGKARELGATLENAEAIVAVLTPLVEAAGVAASGETEADSKGILSTDEDAITDPNALSDDQSADLRAAGLLF